MRFLLALALASVLLTAPTLVLGAAVPAPVPDGPSFDVLPFCPLTGDIVVCIPPGNCLILIDLGGTLVCVG